MKKKNEGAILPKVSATTEIQVLHGGVSNQRVLLIVAVSLLVGFILGATVAILKTKKDPRNLEALIALFTGAEKAKEEKKKG
jgi:hypothetical protein